MIVELFDGTSYSINKALKLELDILLSNCKYDEMDVLILVTGPEGWGKSHAMRALGKYSATFLGTTFNVDNIHFDLKVYKKVSLKGAAWQVNVLDESRKALGKGKVRNPEVEDFLDYISECRKKQQVHIIGLPAYHDLKPYIVKWRQQMIIHFLPNYVKDETRPSGYRMKRGEFRLFTNKDQINYYYEHPYKYPTSYSVRDWWSSKDAFSPEEKEAYEKKKDEYTLLKYDESDDKNKNPAKIKRDFRDAVLKRMLLAGIPIKHAAQYLGQGESTIHDAKNKIFPNGVPSAKDSVI